MRLATRSLALLVLTALTLTSAGCGGVNKDQLIGKWKMVSITPKDGQEQKVEFGGVAVIMEFTADGNIRAGADLTNVAPELKEMIAKNKEASETKQVGKYKLSGSTIEFVDMDTKGGGPPFGKKNGGKIKIDGDTMTISGDDGTIKFTRAK